MRNPQRLLRAIELEDPTMEDTEELAGLLADASEMITRCTKLRDDLELELSARMDADMVTLPGIGYLSRTREATSRWKDKDSGDILRHDLREAIATRLASNIRTGEMDDMTRNVVRLAIDAAYEVIPAFSSIKAAGRKLGIDVGDYREFGVRYRVAVIPLAPEGTATDE